MQSQYLMVLIHAESNDQVAHISAQVMLLLNLTASRSGLARHSCWLHLMHGARVMGMQEAAADKTETVVKSEVPAAAEQSNASKEEATADDKSGKAAAATKRVKRTDELLLQAFRYFDRTGAASLHPAVCAFALTRCVSCRPTCAL